MAFTTGTLTNIFRAITGSGEGVLPILEKSDGSGVAAQAGANNGLYVEYPAGATAPLPTGGATSALQTALNALITTLNGLATTPTIPTQITASDDTDVSSVTAKGLLVETAGDLAVRGTGAPSTTVTITVAAGQYVPLQCSRVMAATTATVVGLS